MELFEKKQRIGTDLEWSQFCRLGEMIGDGLHNEPDGRWISREYKRLMLKLNPDIKESFEAKRKQKADHLDKQIANIISVNKCSKCGGDLRQSRKGSLIMYCTNCASRFKAVKQK